MFLLEGACIIFFPCKFKVDRTNLFINKSTTISPTLSEIAVDRKVVAVAEPTSKPSTNQSCMGAYESQT